MRTETIRVKTNQKIEMVDITPDITHKIQSSGYKSGVVMAYVPHTTSAITINEGADPDVKRDMLMILDQMVPLKAGYRHAEGNSAAHIKASLVGQSVLFGVDDGKLVLGTWQSIFFCEFDGPRVRRVDIHYLSSSG
ncbi:MAG: secondary thiamine-phosphate synthase enzyme YjbQ [Desulfosalsimonadaceae bacterium]